MYESLLMLAVRVPTSAEYTSFTHKVTKASSEEFGGIANSDNVNIGCSVVEDKRLTFEHLSGKPNCGRLLRLRDHVHMGVQLHTGNWRRYSRRPLHGPSSLELYLSKR